MASKEDVKYVISEDPALKGENKPLKAIKRRNTIFKSQLAEDVQEQVTNYLDCGICLNVLEKPVECNTCRRSFCKTCVEEYVALCQNKAKVLCPNCRNEPFSTGEAHPMLKRALTKLTVKCENAARGCKEMIHYDDIDQHRKECLFVEMICQNFGCEKRLLRKEFAEHDQACEFRVVRCSKCDGIQNSS